MLDSRFNTDAQVRTSDSDELEIIKFYHERLSKVIAEIELSVKKLKSYEALESEEQAKK